MSSRAKITERAERAKLIFAGLPTPNHPHGTPAETGGRGGDARRAMYTRSIGRANKGSMKLTDQVNSVVTVIMAIRGKYGLNEIMEIDVVDEKTIIKAKLAYRASYSANRLLNKLGGAMDRELIATTALVLLKLADTALQIHMARNELDLDVIPELELTNSVESLLSRCRALEPWVK